MRIKKRKIIPLSLYLSMVLALNINAEEKTVLEEIKVSENSGYTLSDSVTEGTNSYTTKSMNTATKLNLSVRDTPQSVVVVTSEQIKDENLESIQDITNNIAGFNSPTWDSERVYITSRGFEVDYYQIDGIPTNYSGTQQQDLSMYDRVEVVKGANGLMTGAVNLHRNYISRITII